MWKMGYVVNMKQAQGAWRKAHGTWATATFAHFTLNLLP
jgi:hypothetical protein